jgi:streptogramin lyase
MGACNKIYTLGPLTPSTSSTGLTVYTLAGGGSPNGTVFGYVNAQGTNAEFDSPWGVALDSSGNVYVGDNGNNLVRKINSGGNVTTLAGGGSPTGTNFGYVNAQGTNAEFTTPCGVAVDGSGNVYVCDTYNNLIRKIDSNGNVTTVAGGGSPAGTTAGYINAKGTNAEFYEPRGIAVDGSGNVYVTDSSNALIRKIDTNGNVTTLAGGGSPTGTTIGFFNGPALSAEFDDPLGIAVNSAGTTWYVGDAGNSLIRVIH